MSIHDGYTKKQLNEMESNKWTQQKIEDAEQIISTQDLNSDGVLKLSAGKKRHSLIKSK